MKKLSEISFFQNRSVRIWFAVSALLLFLGGTGFLVWMLSRQMFSGNPRFTLHHVLVRSHRGGYWNGRKSQVCEILRIRTGETNLFQLNPGELRKRLLEREPSIRSVRVIRELPDTLNVDIVERTPVARIHRPDSPQVVDSHTILMPRDRCMNITDTLPIIIGDPKILQCPPGVSVRQLKPAVDLINLTRSSFPNLRIGTVLVSRAGQLKCTVHYKNGSSYYIVTLPDRDLAHYLHVLTATLERLRKDRSSSRNIDLRFKGQVRISFVAARNRISCS